MSDEVRFCQTADGVSIAYKVMGSGPPIVIPPITRPTLGSRSPDKALMTGYWPNIRW